MQKTINFFASIQKTHEYNRWLRRERSRIKFSYATQGSKLWVFPYCKKTFESLFWPTKINTLKSWFHLWLLNVEILESLDGF